MTEICREAILKAVREKKKTNHLTKEDHHSNFRSPLICHPKSQENMSATFQIQEVNNRQVKHSPPKG